MIFKKPEFDLVVIPLSSMNTPIRLEILKFVTYRVGGVNYWNLTIFNFGIIMRGV